MNKAVSMQVLVGMCIVVLAILFFKNKVKSLIVFLMRTGIGTVLILVINEWLARQGIELCVKINLITFLTSGILGFPGVALLFAISALQFL